MYAKFKLKYPAVVNRNQTLLQQDNARPHTATLTIQKIQELGGIELLPYPAYSPDVVPLLSLIQSNRSLSSLKTMIY